MSGSQSKVHECEVDLVSFAPPECDSFLWKAPEPIKVGDWVEVIVERYTHVPFGTKAKVARIDSDGDIWLPAQFGKSYQTCFKEDWLRKCDPPSPTYRPFANAGEFLPHADRWLKWKDDSDGLLFKGAVFSNANVWPGSASVGKSWKEALDAFVFADTNEPCGVKVNA